MLWAFPPLGPIDRGICVPRAKRDGRDRRSGLSSGAKLPAFWSFRIFRITQRLDLLEQLVSHGVELLGCDPIASTSAARR